MSQPPEDPVKTLWQSQEPENPTMTVQAIRLLVKDSEASRRRILTCAFAVDAAVVAVVLWGAWTAPNTLVRVAELIMLAWAPLMVLYHLRRWPGRTPGSEATVQALLDYRRAEIAREAPDLKLIGLALAPVAVSLVLLLIAVWDKASRMHPSPLPIFGGLIAAWAIATVFQINRQRRRVAERLRDLDALRG